METATQGLGSGAGKEDGTTTLENRMDMDIGHYYLQFGLEANRKETEK